MPKRRRDDSDNGEDHDNDSGNDSDILEEDADEATKRPKKKRTRLHSPLSGKEAQSKDDDDVEEDSEIEEEDETKRVADAKPPAAPRLQTSAHQTPGNLKRDTNAPRQSQWTSNAYAPESTSNASANEIATPTRTLLSTATSQGTGRVPPSATPAAASTSTSQPMVQPTGNLNRIPPPKRLQRLGYFVMGAMAAVLISMLTSEATKFTLALIGNAPQAANHTIHVAQSLVAVDTVTYGDKQDGEEDSNDDCDVSLSATFPTSMVHTDENMPPAPIHMVAPFNEKDKKNDNNKMVVTRKALEEIDQVLVVHDHSSSLLARSHIQAILEDNAADGDWKLQVTRNELEMIDQALAMGEMHSWTLRARSLTREIIEKADHPIDG